MRSFYYLLSLHLPLLNGTLPICIDSLFLISVLYFFCLPAVQSEVGLQAINLLIAGPSVSGQKKATMKKMKVMQAEVRTKVEGRK